MRERLGVLGHLGLVLVEHLVGGALAHDLAHGRFGHLADQLLGAGGQVVLEEEVARVVDAVLHGVLQVDDALITREDERLLGHLGAHRVAIAHLDLAQPRAIDDLVRLDGIRQVPLDTRVVREVAELAKAQHRGHLAFLHDVEATAQPGQTGHDANNRQTREQAASGGRGIATTTDGHAATATLAATLSTQQAVELAAQILPELVEIGRPIGRALRLRALGLPRRRRRGWRTRRGLLIRATGTTGLGRPAGRGRRCGRRRILVLAGSGTSAPARIIRGRHGLTVP